MSNHHDIQLHFAIAIGIWASALVAAVVTVTCRSRAGMSPRTEAAPDQGKVARPVHGESATWMLAEPVPAPAQDQLTVMAATQEKSPADAGDDGPYEFYECFEEGRNAMQATAATPDALNENHRASLVGYGYQVIEGTLQRADYQKGQLRIVAQGRVWAFVVDSASQLRFDGRPAILRCFHPLDHVEICFEDVDGLHVVRGLHASANQSL